MWGNNVIRYAPMTNENSNKQTAVAFYQLMFNDCRPAEAISLYAGETYIQHNPHVADGKDG
jgi:predicted SnoaL-like aldol condensation-catalyzing enzyme